MPDLALLLPIAQVSADRLAALDGYSAAFLLAALSAIDDRFMWSNNGIDLSDSEWDNVEAWIATAYQEVMVNALIGSVFPYISTNPPPDCLPLEGGTYSASDYPALFAVLDSFYKGVDTFTLPDMRGRFVLGASLTYPVASAGGEESHILTESEMPVHSHTYTSPILGDLDFEDIGVPQPAAAINPIPQSTGTAGGGQAHNNLPPYIALKYCVVAL